MKVIICGAGKVGFNIARYLAQEDNDITVIDHSDELVAKLSRSIDVRGVVGFASHPDVLMKAGIQNADMIIAVTYADEVNMVACQVAHSLFHVPTKIARVRDKSYLNPAWSSLYDPGNMPIDLIISPEIEVAKAIRRGIEVPGTSFDVLPLIDGRVRLVGVKCSVRSPILSTPLRLLGGLFPELDMEVISIMRQGVPIIPEDTDEVKLGDEVYFLVDKNQVAQAMSAFGFEAENSPKTLILGGGNIGFTLAETLNQKWPDMTVTLIEKDKDRALLAAGQLPNSLILQGDALDREVLEEAGVSNTSTVVSVTTDDKTNILSCLLAKSLGAAQSMALVNSSSYSSLVSSLNIDAVVSPKALTVSKILHYVRRGQVRRIHSLRDNMGEVIEAVAAGTSSVLGMEVKDINVPNQMKVGLIFRDDAIVLPRPNTEIRLNDRVIMMMKIDAIKRFEKLFSLRLGYF